MSLPQVGIVLTTLNWTWTLKSLPDLIINTDYPNYRLYLMHDAASLTDAILLDNIHKFVEGMGIKVQSLYTSDRKGIGYWWNQGIELAIDDKSDYIVVLNNDIAFPPKEFKWLHILVDVMKEKSKYGAVSPEWWWVGEPWEGGIEKFKSGYYDHIKANFTKSMIDGGLGCFFCLRKEAVESLKQIESQTEQFPGLFDYKNFPCCWEEIDYFKRLEGAGWKVGISPQVALYHKGSATTCGDTWKAVIQQDYKSGHKNFCTKWELPYPPKDFRVEFGRYNYVM